MGICRYFCAFTKNRKDKIFNKGQGKISEDLDVRTYIKSVRNLKIMENVLLNENQRTLMNYQKAKVIESGSTSNSDDKCVEPAVLQACD